MPMSPHLAELRAAVGHRLLLLPSVTVLPRDEEDRLLLVRELDTGLWKVAYVSVVYDAVVVGGQPTPDGEETMDVQWFSPEQLETLPLGDFARASLTALGLLPRSPRDPCLHLLADS